MKNSNRTAEIEQHYFLLASLGAFANQIDADIDEYLGGLTWKQYCFLNEIRRFNQSPSIAELAESLGTTRQNAKVILQNLKQKNLVILKHEENNKKTQRISLTERCNELLAIYDDKVTLLVNEALKGVSSEQVQATLDTINQIQMNIENSCSVTEEGSPLINIVTWDGKLIEASHFKICKIQPHTKGQPKYQLYASKGSLIQVSGINRHIIGFYDSKDRIQQEINEINEARQNRKSEYTVKYWCHVSFTKLGTVIKED